MTKMQHHLRHATGQEDLNGCEVVGSIWQGIDQARHSAIDGSPIIRRRAAKAGSMGDRRNVQKKIGRSAKSGVYDHSVSDRRVRQDATRANAELRQP